MKLTDNLDGIIPDPIRYWVGVAKDAGAVNMFTIGVPDKMPEDALKVYAEAVHRQESKNATGYPPFVGENAMREAILKMEPKFGAELTEEDFHRLYVTVGASQALQFMFSLFPAGSEILVNTPAWGTIHNMVAHSGNKGVPAAFFTDGEFVHENAEAALTKKTRAVYVNFPANPTASMVPVKELEEMCGWAVSNNLEIISDEPYKYIIFDRNKTPYESPVSFSDDISGHVSLVSSFSKIVKPDIRLGFIRVSPAVLDSHKMVAFYFRNLSAGASRGIQAGVTALIEKDPTLPFLEEVIEGYKTKSELVQKVLGEWGCDFPYQPTGTYMVFPTTPDDGDSEEFVKKMAAERKTGFIPGTSFGGSFKGFEHLRKHFRMGFGAGMTVEKLEEALGQLTR